MALKHHLVAACVGDLDEGVPVFNGSNLTGFTTIDAELRFVTNEKAKSLGRALASRVTEQSTSAYPSIKSLNLEQIEIPVPTKEELDKIKPQPDSLFEFIAQNERESRALGELRDALLPKLTSGEIEVSQIGP